MIVSDGSRCERSDRKTKRNMLGALQLPDTEKLECMSSWAALFITTDIQIGEGASKRVA